MKIMYTLAALLCSLACAHADPAVIPAQKPESQRHKAIMRQFERYFKDSLETQQEKIAFMRFNSVEDRTDKAWDASPLSQPRFATINDVTARLPRSFKISDGVTFQLKSDVIVYRLDSADRFTLTSLPYGAAGLAFKKRV